MNREAEFDLTLNLPCSAGILVHDLETRVTVQYEIDGDSADWKLTSVRLDGEPGTIRKGDLLWPLFEQAVGEKKVSRIVVEEIFNEEQLRPATAADAKRELELV